MTSQQMIKKMINSKKDMIEIFICKRGDKKSSYAIKKFIRTFDLQKYLNNNNIDYGEVSSEKPQYKVYTCPFCKNVNYKGNEHPNRLYVNKDSKLFTCYNCNEEGSLLTLLAGFEGVSLKKIFDKYLNREFFEALPKHLTNMIEKKIVKARNNDIPEIDMPDEFLPVFTRPQRAGRPAYQYWLDRGITRPNNNGEDNHGLVIDRKIAQQLDVRYVDSYAYSTPSGKTHFINKRIIFPVWTGEWYKRRFVGFQGRDITGESKLPYYISEGFPKTKVVHNYEFVFEAETITICEGIFDMVKCWDNNPICLFGKHISLRQMELLQQMPNLKNVVLALDPDTKVKDKQGNIPFNKLAEKLQPFWNVYDINIPEGKDAGDFTREEMNEIIANKFPYRKKGLTILI